MHSHSNVLLPDVAGGWALPQAGVALEALGRELTMEELHNQLGEHGALGRVAAGSRQQRLVESLDVRIADVILAAASGCQRHRTVAERRAVGGRDWGSHESDEPGGSEGHAGQHSRHKKAT